MDNARLNEEALNWLIRLGHPGFDDWIALTEWLAASPAHALVFNHLQAAEADLLDDLTRGRRPAIAAAATVPAHTKCLESDATNDNTFGRRLLPVGIAATVALLVTLGFWHDNYRHVAAPWPEYRTMAGAHKELHLPDGSQLALNGDTVVRLAPEARSVVLISGQALFRVQHDAERPFTVIAGKTTIIDLGTSFDVVRERGRITITIGEGSVELKDERWPDMVLSAGDGVEIVGSNLRRFTQQRADIGSWRQGRLRYEDAPVSRVLADVGRTRGLKVEIGPDAQNCRFTGSISLLGSDEEVKARLRLLLMAKEPH
ncbi:FecR domain-containing protein [Novosphingobium sp. AP12]|uniref:FecR family protein n=1 Tax=Novosphingobium sp. AP12 TaxID=1144305 RepID=UPI000271E1E1|nr:FecR domain-containing protein [Novosphingobium sp. AP12]EJL35393.1 Fe2+-dicitrate sensor, membrane component [Novosphingobium sp. AP12]